MTAPNVFEFYAGLRVAYQTICFLYFGIVFESSSPYSALRETASNHVGFLQKHLQPKPFLYKNSFFLDHDQNMKGATCTAKAQFTFKRAIFKSAKCTLLSALLL